MLEAEIEINGKSELVTFQFNYQPAEPEVNFQESAEIFNVRLNGVEIMVDDSEMEKLIEVAVIHHHEVEKDFIERLHEHTYELSKEAA